jgi:hypothetical protein
MRTYTESDGDQGVSMGHGATGWLTCRLDSGMFSDEVAVTYPATKHWQKSVFVPRACVRQEAANTGQVKVLVLVKDGTRYAVLPTPRRDIVRVEGADLHP